jgi:anaerobic selenocysteine-containing dehydrogenase/ferredoxin-NADP reductase
MAAEIVSGYCTLCRSRCGAGHRIEDGRLTEVLPLPGHPTGGALCAKGRAAPELLYSPRRLTKPLRRRASRGAPDPLWQEIEWDEALDEIASRLADTRDLHGAEAVAFAVTTPSGTPMVDSFEWVERFIRCFGSPNLIYAVEVCGWHKDYAHELTFGRGIGFPDYDNADVIVLWGHNPARTWLAQASRVAASRRRGAKLIVIDPKPNGSGQDADLYLRVRPGADAALAMGAIHHLLKSRTFDRDFAARWTNAPMLIDTQTGRLLRADSIWSGADPEAFVVCNVDGQIRPYSTRHELERAEDVDLTAEINLSLPDGSSVVATTALQMLAKKAEPYTPEQTAALTWLAVEDVRAFNAAFEKGPRLTYHSWTGVGQHTNATQTERAIASLYALTGACDKPGGNIWPVAPPARSLNSYDLLPETQRRKALGLEELPLGPPTHGWITARDFARAVLAGEPYRVRMLMSFGTNLIVSQSHSERNRTALEALDFHVHVDSFMNPTAMNADIVLPASMPWENDALKIGFEITQEAAETVQFRPRMVEPLGECRADYDIAAELALRLGHGEAFFGGSIRDGWNYQLEPLGVTIDDLLADPAGRRIAQPFSHQKHKKICENGEVAGFATPTRRVELYSEKLLDHGYQPAATFDEPAESPTGSAHGEEFPIVLTTAKSGWFVHSSHRHVASLRRKSPEASIEIHPALAESCRLDVGSWAIVSTRSGSVRLQVRFNDALDERVAVSEYGWWEDCPPLGRNSEDPSRSKFGRLSSNINEILSDDARDPVSGSTPLRATLCSIRPDTKANRGRWVGQRRFVVRSATPESDDVMSLEFSPTDGGPVAEFLPGQHCQVRLAPDGLSRAYSLTGVADRNVSLSVAVRKAPFDSRQPPEGHLSHAFHRLKPGDQIWLDAPNGVFCPPLSGARPLIFLAAGIGITPFVGHVETLAAKLDTIADPVRILLMYGCRSGSQNPFGARLRALSRTLPQLQLVTAFSRPDRQDIEGEHYDYKGRLDIAPIAGLLPQRPLVYLCGAEGFVTETKRRIADLGVPSFDIFAESFVSPVAVPPTLEPRTIRIAGSERSFVWVPDQGTILDAAEKAGISLPSGCRVGQCESCAVTVVEGQFAHLSATDTEEKKCLTCCAVPLSPLVIAP